MKKKISITTIIIIIIFTLFLLFNNQNKKIIYLITGTYNHETAPYNTLVFEEETMIYHLYTLDSKAENKGEFLFKSDNEYLLTSGPLEGCSVQISKDTINLVNKNTDTKETYHKTSSIPAIQSNFE